ncbi:transcription factor bHLH128-like [Triticum dicoccoides]|nr:transcription factor bHLH128-like [Triticum dicoccoides]
MLTTYLDMPGMDDYLQLQQDFIACTVHTKHGCATHPRSIAERERRASNSKRLRRLQDFVPNMDKQTTMSDKDLEYLLISGERVASRPKRPSSWWYPTPLGFFFFHAYTALAFF